MSAVEFFEVSAEDTKRAQDFYSAVFGWQFETSQFGEMDYTFIKTNDQGKGIQGGMMQRQNPGQAITNYVSVESIETTCAQIIASGGKVLMPKQKVDKVGALAVCMDTENNTFGLWEHEKQ